MLNYVLDSAHVSGGWLALAAVGIAVLAYFLGCFNGAVVVSRYILRDDVRNHGSGNAGLTNFYRTFGGPLTLVVILSDAVKAVVAVLFAMWIAGSISPELIALSKYWAGLFCLLGHMFPVTFQFRGGKGILSGGTIALMMDWRVALVVWGGFLILAIATRYVSLGSCWAGLSFPFVTWFVYQDELITVLAVIIGGLILWKHRGNMVRIAKGTESKFALHKKKEAEAEPEAPDPSEEIEETMEEQGEPETPADQVDEETSEQEEESSTQEESAEEVSDDQEEKKLQEGEA
ncbi:acyl-phosphate glycerol 3-phosphate acyltransferase [Pseudoflavonifractor sp. An176]|uniref:glycerol-3-phosphate acyltransferase n=1 Tax=Pseudoflavonifractor sp. An176 TaxID=1965572 RepID=UPI000B375BDB|nr:glycerol-3-phosphate acyltransferase [Pseudoflavonifractor sp. An176]OUP66147.1 acyl-phosphate glycerol 3-phosphate acyltransferase [Pseudoflavonifractor sp. An176]